MSLAGVSDVVTDWRALRNGFRLFGATGDAVSATRDAGLDVAGTLDDLLGQVDVVVDCTPKRIAGSNVDPYRRRRLKFIVQGGEKHTATGHYWMSVLRLRAARTATRVHLVASRDGTEHLAAARTYRRPADGHRAIQRRRDYQRRPQRQRDLMESAAEQLYGYTAAEVLGQPNKRIIPAERFAEEDDIVRRVVAGEFVPTFETVRIRQDGSGLR
jgi:PAS domain-containing protein